MRFIQNNKEDSDEHDHLSHWERARGAGQAHHIYMPSKSLDGRGLRESEKEGESEQKKRKNNSELMRGSQ